MKLHYDKDEDILMLVLSDKKIDDSFETKNSVVEVAEDGEPVIVTIFDATKFFKEESRILPWEIKQKFFALRPIR